MAPSPGLRVVVTGLGHDQSPSSAVVRKSAPKIPGFPGTWWGRGPHVLRGAQRSSGHWAWAVLLAMPPTKTPPSLGSSGLTPWSLPTNPLNPHLQPGVWLPQAGCQAGAPQGPRWAQADPRWRAGPRPVPGVCLQVPSAPHRLVSQGFSTQNAPAREAAGLMSYVRALPPRPPAPPGRRTAARGHPGRTRGAWDGAPDPSACGTGLWDEPRGWPHPDHQHGRSPP